MPTRTEYAHGEFCWVDLMAHDAGQASEFYGNLFGWKSFAQDTQGGPPYVIFQVDGQDVAGLGEMTAEMKAQGVPPIWNSTISVDDVNAVADKVSQLGGTVTMPPMKVVEAGWLAMIQDPTGGNVAIWQKNQHFGAKRVNETGSFGWNELATRDPERAQQFYSQLLGWEFAKDETSPGPYYLIKNRGRDNGGMLPMDESWGEIPTHWTVYFYVDDTDETIKRVEQLGGQVRVAPVDIPIGRFAVVADNQGAHFSIIQLTVAPD